MIATPPAPKKGEPDNFLALVRELLTYEEQGQLERHPKGKRMLEKIRTTVQAIEDGTAAFDGA